jgi:ABC-type nitrate/sulfonate/bicarbonate transport system substrate-binding protein
MRSRIVLCWSLVLGLELAAPAGAETVKIGYMGVINQSDMVSLDKGFYKKQGLEVELPLFQTGAAAIQGLISGDLQAVEVGPVPMLNLAAQGLPLYFLVSGGINVPGKSAGVMMVRPDDTSLKTFADLKGKKVGQLGKGTITYFWLFNAAAQAGIAHSDFQEIFVPFPQMGGLLASKQVDAVYAWPPFDTYIEQAGQGKRMMGDTSFNPYAVINALVVRKEWADKNPAVLSGLIKASIETGRWIDDHQDEAREVMGKHLGMAEAAYKAMYMFHFPRNGYQVMPDIWDFYYLMTKTGELKPFADPAAVIKKYWLDPAAQFIAPAIAELGAEPDPIVDDLLKVKLMNLPESPEHYYGPWEH